MLFDQRGCGRSTPHVADGADLSVNTTDASPRPTSELLRSHSASTGGRCSAGRGARTLALAYAQKHPDRVTELVLRGIFLLRRNEIDWYYNGGAGHLFPELWEEFLAPVPECASAAATSSRPTTGCCTSDDPDVATRAAVAWSAWEGATSSLLPEPDEWSETSEPTVRAGVRPHREPLLPHGGFLDEGQLLAGRRRDWTAFRA